MGRKYIIMSNNNTHNKLYPYALGYENHNSIFSEPLKWQVNMYMVIELNLVGIHLKKYNGKIKNDSYVFKTKEDGERFLEEIIYPRVIMNKLQGKN